MQAALPQPLAAEPLARLLLQWGVAPVPAAPVAERLGGWLGWADAIGLSQVLATAPAASANPVARREAADWAGAALDRLDDDSELWVGIITGTPTVFSAGTDLASARDTRFRWYMGLAYGPTRTSGRH